MADHSESLREASARIEGLELGLRAANAERVEIVEHRHHTGATCELISIESGLPLEVVRAMFPEPTHTVSVRQAAARLGVEVSELMRRVSELGLRSDDDYGHLSFTWAELESIRTKMESDLDPLSL